MRDRHSRPLTSTLLFGPFMVKSLIGLLLQKLRIHLIVHLSIVMILVPAFFIFHDFLNVLGRPACKCVAS